MRHHTFLAGLAALLSAALACASASAQEPAPAPAEAPAQAAPATPPPVAGGLSFSGKTEMVDGPALQIVFGERAVFHLDAKGEPVLDGVEKGALAMAHPAGAANETFGPPGPGKLAVALDGSPEKQASYLKIWNGLDHPVLYHAGVLAYVDGALKPMSVKVCAAPAGATNSMTWPAPIAAAVVANFKAAPSATACN